MTSTTVLIIVLISFVISLITVFMMKSSLKTARRNNAAVTYVTDDSFEVTYSYDKFLYTERTEEKISDDNDN